MRGLVVAAMIVAMVSGANAADMPDIPILRGGITEGLSATHVNWHGFYVGGQASYGSARSKNSSTMNSDMQATFTAPGGATYAWASLSQIRAVSTGFGAYGGYNWQFEDVVLGLEGNYLHGGYRGTTGGLASTATAVTSSMATVDLTDFGTARIRAGYSWGCFLPYGFVGAGFGNRTIQREVNARPVSLGNAWYSDRKDTLVYGYSAGVGMDVMLIGGLFGRVEYEYLRVTSSAFETAVNSVRAGLGYKF